jgi:hypothetical protein
MIRRTFAFFRERSFVYSAESYESIGVMAPQNLIAYMSSEQITQEAAATTQTRKR